MAKYRFLTTTSLFIVFFSFLSTTNIKAASGDFFNVTKQAKYSKANLVSNKTLAQQLQSEYDNGDIIVKELSGGKTINYGEANNQLLQLLQTMSVQEAVVSVISSPTVIVDRTATGLDNFAEAQLSSEDFDIDTIE